MSINAPALYTFYETPVFSEDLDDFLGEDALGLLYAIQADLIAAPERWPVVKGTGGARKGRISDPASKRGKSSSYRYLYLYVEHRGQIYLLFLFAKSEQANLTAEETKLVAGMVEAIKQMTRREKS